MIDFDDLLRTKNEALKKEFVGLLFKEELITQAVYYKAIELLGKENKNGNIK